MLFTTSIKSLKQTTASFNQIVTVAIAAHYGFLYEVKRGFRCVESQILNASSTGFSNIRLCTFDEPIKLDILKLKKVVQKVT